MKLLLVVPWDQEFGGLAYVVGNLAKYLKDHGHTVFFLHPGGSSTPRRRTSTWGFPGYEMDLRGPFVKERPIRSVIAFVVMLVPTLWRLRSLIKTHGIEIVNVHYPLERFLYFGVLRWLAPIRVVVSVHGADLFPAGKGLVRYPWSLSFLMRTADAVVAPSRAFLKDVLSVFPSIRNRAVAIHNGVDIDELLRTDEKATVEQVRPYLLTIASHNEKKALDVLLRAFVRISKRHTNLRLLLVGDGPLRHQNEALAHALSIANSVEFLGWRSRAEVGRLLRNCLVFVLPSRSEPFGIVVVEALACRRPVVASSVGGIQEIIDNERSGIIVEPDRPEQLAEAVLRVLEDATLRERIANAGLRRVEEHFSCERTGSRYEGLYSTLLPSSVFVSG